jgi:DNA-binding response OmpR family regulator
LQLALLDADSDFAKSVTYLMAQCGHHVRHFRDARSMLRSLRQDAFDLLMLEWDLIDSNGPEVLAWVQDNLDAPPPTMIIGGPEAERDIVSGLTRGAADYILKPLQDDVLRGRVAALLRRVYGDMAKPSVERVGHYAFDIENQKITVAGFPVATTAKEFALALLLFRNLHRPLSRNHIVETIWGHASDPSSRTLDAHVSQIRNRLNIRPEYGFRLSSVYSFGYRLTQLSAKAASPPSNRREALQGLKSVSS